MTRVYLIGDDTPIWITEPSDILIGRLEDVHEDTMLAVNVINWSPGCDHDYSESTGFIRAGHITFVAPLWRNIRDQVIDAKAETA